jgi:hypothetical protein
MRMNKCCETDVYVCDIIEDMPYSYRIIIGNTSHYVGNEIDI